MEENIMVDSVVTEDLNEVEPDTAVGLKEMKKLRLKSGGNMQYLVWQ